MIGWGVVEFWKGEEIGETNEYGYKIRGGGVVQEFDNEQPEVYLRDVAWEQFEHEECIGFESEEFWESGGGFGLGLVNNMCIQYYVLLLLLRKV